MSDLWACQISARQDFLMWTSTAKPTMKPGPSDTAGIKRKEHSCKRTPHISKIKVVEGEGVKDQLLSPWGWQESSSSAGVRQVMSRSSEEPHLCFWKRLRGFRRLFSTRGSPTECLGPQGSVLTYPEGTGPPPENQGLGVSHPWVRAAAP